VTNIVKQVVAHHTFMASQSWAACNGEIVAFSLQVA